LIITELMGIGDKKQWAAGSGQPAILRDKFDFIVRLGSFFLGFPKIE
jgi:hypothetical protein